MADGVQGRSTPSAYRDEYCELVKELLADGSSFARFRAEVGIAKSTFYLWRKTYPDFDEACQVADAMSAVWWESRAREASGLTGSKGAPALILAGLYNRGGGDWSNKQEVVQKVEEDDKLDLSKLTEAELEALDVLTAAKERLRG